MIVTFFTTQPPQTEQYVYVHLRISGRRIIFIDFVLSENPNQIIFSPHWSFIKDLDFDDNTHVHLSDFCKINFLCINTWTLFQIKLIMKKKSHIYSCIWTYNQSLYSIFDWFIPKEKNNYNLIVFKIDIHVFGYR